MRRATSASAKVDTTPARRFHDATTRQGRLEMDAVTGVAGERAFVEDGDAEHECAGDRGCQAGTDDFDLGEFRHAR